jgi:hypothetical protein
VFAKSAKVKDFTDIVVIKENVSIFKESGLTT